MAVDVTVSQYKDRNPPMYIHTLIKKEPIKVHTRPSNLTTINVNYFTGYGRGQGAETPEAATNNNHSAAGRWERLNFML